jgi:hypothetical protein
MAMVNLGITKLASNATAALSRENLDFLVYKLQTAMHKIIYRS